MNFSIAVNFALDYKDLRRCLKASTCVRGKCDWTEMTTELADRKPALIMPWKKPITIVVPPERCEEHKKEWTCYRSLIDHYNDPKYDPHMEEIQAKVTYL